MAAKHSVLNPDKDKILVVFDCSSQYRGILITENLFYGPYLTNPLISALKKISLGLVASMVYIQTLGYKEIVDYSWDSDAGYFGFGNSRSRNVF